jgi:hypothetical protein
VWKLLEVAQIQNGGCCHGYQAAKNVKKIKNPPFFISMATATMFVLQIPIFFWFISFH